jgi:uncharacterized protein YkwD
MSRTSILLLLLLVIASVGIAPALAASETYGIDSEEQAFYKLVNDYRVANGLQPFVLSTKLTAASASWSEVMAAQNALYHDPNWVTRIRNTGYTSYTTLGENVYMGSGYLGGASYAFTGWKNSAGHNANMLNPSFRAIGIGRAFSASRNAYYWTTDFGSTNDGDNIMVPSGTSAPTPTTPVPTQTPTQNHAPVLTSIGSKSVTEGSLLSFVVSASDVDGNTLTYTASNLPYGASFSAGARTFSWTPSGTQAGSYQVTFRVTDGYLSDLETVTITVIDSSVSVSGPDNIDADEQTLYNLINQYRIANGQQALVLSTKLTVAAASWSRTMAEQNSLYHDPNWVTRIRNTGYSRYASLGENVYMGSSYYGNPNYVFQGWQSSAGHNANMLNGNFRAIGIGKAYNPARNTYYWTIDLGSVNDGDNIMVPSGSATPTPAPSPSPSATPTPKPSPSPAPTPTPSSSTNQAPVFQSIGTKVAYQGSTLSFTVTATDPDGNSLTYGTAGLPRGASFDASTRTFSWTPSSSQSGIFRVTFTASDGSLTATKTAMILVYKS